jgi:hypothetical protein
MIQTARRASLRGIRDRCPSSLPFTVPPADEDGFSFEPKSKFGPNRRVSPKARNHQDYFPSSSLHLCPTPIILSHSPPSFTYILSLTPTCNSANLPRPSIGIQGAGIKDLRPPELCARRPEIRNASASWYLSTPPVIPPALNSPQLAPSARVNHGPSLAISPKIPNLNAFSDSRYRKSPPPGALTYPSSHALDGG